MDGRPDLPVTLAPLPLVEHQKQCPYCNSEQVMLRAATSPESCLDWFECEDCRHLWAFEHEIQSSNGR